MGIASGPPGLCRTFLDLWIASGRDAEHLRFIDEVAPEVVSTAAEVATVIGQDGITDLTNAPDVACVPTAAVTALGTHCDARTTDEAMVPNCGGDKAWDM